MVVAVSVVQDQDRVFIQELQAVRSVSVNEELGLNTDTGRGSPAAAPDRAGPIQNLGVGNDVEHDSAIGARDLLALGLVSGDISVLPTDGVMPLAMRQLPWDKI